MAKKQRTSESALAAVVYAALRRTRAKRATLAEIRDTVPQLCRLTSGDKATSPSRPGEPVWWNTVRNIRAHNSGRKHGLKATPEGFALAKPPAKPAPVREFIARPNHREGAR